MKELTVYEAQIKIIEYMKLFNELAQSNKSQQVKFNVTIENVRFTDFFLLYSRTRTKFKRLLMPGEFGTETMVMIYNPAPGFVICIESTQCISSKFEFMNFEQQRIKAVNLINLN